MEDKNSKLFSNTVVLVDRHLKQSSNAFNLATLMPITSFDKHKERHRLLKVCDQKRLFFHPKAIAVADYETKASRVSLVPYVSVTSDQGAIWRDDNYLSKKFQLTVPCVLFV